MDVGLCTEPRTLEAVSVTERNGGAFIKLPIKETNMRKNINNILYPANWIHCTSENSGECGRVVVGLSFRFSSVASQGRRNFTRHERSSRYSAIVCVDDMKGLFMEGHNSSHC